MIIYLDNSKEKIPETISNYDYIAGYKVNTPKSVSFLSISNRWNLISGERYHSQ